MTTHPNPSICDTRSGAHSAKNARQTGAPNHLQGSGENPMVGVTTTPDAGMVSAVRDRLGGQTYRFLSADHRGLSVNLAALADLIAEIVTEYTEHVIAERDAL